MRRTSLASSRRDLRLVLLLGVTVVVWLAFHFIFTDGFVLTPRNLSTLSVQMTVTAILAMGMTMLLIAREIDLSAGAVMALVMVLVFQFQITLGLSATSTVLLALAAGAVVGLLHGALRVWLLIPSFIITLAGFSWLRGVAYIIPDGQTLAGASDGFYRISNSEVPPIASAALIVLVAVPLVGRAGFRMLSTGEKPTLTRVMEVIQFAQLLAFALGAAWAFYNHRGLPYPTLLLGVLAFGLHWLMQNTDFGRHVYAVGGNPEAAKRVGINVRLIVVLLFVFMGILTGFAAVVQASLLDAAPPGIGGGAPAGLPVRRAAAQRAGRRGFRWIVRLRSPENCLKS